MRDNEIRRKSGMLYEEMVKNAVTIFVQELEQDQSLPMITLTRSQLDSAEWKVPTAYKELLLRVTVKMAIRHDYRLTPVQSTLALLEAALLNKRLHFEDEAKVLH